MNWIVFITAGVLLPIGGHKLCSPMANFMPDQLTFPIVIQSVGTIGLPPGYIRSIESPASFTNWLRSIELRKDKTVYLYNGQPKPNQQAQFAVLAVPVGKRDLQQCADAVMRLRASWLYCNNRFSEIAFYDNLHRAYRYNKGKDSLQFERYLENVYAFCGTLSLQQQLKPAGRLQSIQPGDVLIRGGSPGHAVMVVDVAINNEGKKIYLLAQSYMPAQDIHILKNPANPILSPWYDADKPGDIITPEWVFKQDALRRW